jgi:hypothetical protein
MGHTRIAVLLAKDAGPPIAFGGLEESVHRTVAHAEANAALDTFVFVNVRAPALFVNRSDRTVRQTHAAASAIVVDAHGLLLLLE